MKLKNILKSGKKETKKVEVKKVVIFYVYQRLSKRQKLMKLRNKEMMSLSVSNKTLKRNNYQSQKWPKESKLINSLKKILTHQNMLLRKNKK